MNMDISAAAARLTEQVRSAEATTDAAILAKVRLMETMIIARQNVEATARSIGHGALVRLVKSLQDDIESSTNLFRTHSELDKVGIAYGIMDEDDKPTRPSAMTSVA